MSPFETTFSDTFGLGVSGCLIVTVDAFPLTRISIMFFLLFFGWQIGMIDGVLLCPGFIFFGLPGFNYANNSCSVNQSVALNAYALLFFKSLFLFSAYTHYNAYITLNNYVKMAYSLFALFCFDR